MLNFYDTLRMLNRVATASYKPMLKEIGETIRDSIQTKTARGVDWLNHKFSPYREVYRRMKQKKGLYPPVNLRLTGTMLNDLTQTQDDKECRVFFQSSKSEEKAAVNQEGRKPRHFFDISPEAEKEIDQIVNEYIDGLFRGI